MPKTFYTERDIEDLNARGITSLVVTDEVVVTDLGRERAMKLGMELVREKAKDAPPSAPVRPYIAKQTSPSAAAKPASTPSPAESKGEIEQRVVSAVKARLGDSVDAKLLETIVKRVIDSVGTK